jgi:hypothetical protein
MTKYRSDRKVTLLVPFVTYAHQPLMTFREWVAFSIGIMVGGGLACLVIWLIGVRQ